MTWYFLPYLGIVLFILVFSTILTACFILKIKGDWEENDD